MHAGIEPGEQFLVLRREAAIDHAQDPPEFGARRCEPGDEGLELVDRIAPAVSQHEHVARAGGRHGLDAAVGPRPGGDHAEAGVDAVRRLTGGKQHRRPVGAVEAAFDQVGHDLPPSRARRPENEINERFHRRERRRPTARRANPHLRRAVAPTCGLQLRRSRLPASRFRAEPARPATPAATATAAGGGPPCRQRMRYSLFVSSRAATIVRVARVSRPVAPWMSPASVHGSGDPCHLWLRPQAAVRNGRARMRRSGSARSGGASGRPARAPPSPRRSARRAAARTGHAGRGPEARPAGPRRRPWPAGGESWRSA